MAAEVTNLPPVRLPATSATLTPDQRYWAAFSSQQLIPTPNSAPVTFISTNSLSLPTGRTSLTPPTPYIVATSGPRLQLFSPQTLKLVRTIARTSSSLHGASVRPDGRIVVAGSDSGVIQAFDTNSRAILKTWDQHKQPVWVTQWHPRDATSLMSCSDDTTVRLWDLPSDGFVWTGWGHTDYVRTGSFLGDAHLLVTGGYDSSIRIWDTRINAAGSKASVMNFKLSAPVESVLPLPGGTTVAGASGEKVTILDIVAAKPLQQLHNHQKTVTSLSLATKGTRLLTGALDGHVKVFDTSSWSVVAGYKYPSPVLSLCTVFSTADGVDRHVCAGLQSGLLSIRTRMSASARATKRTREKELDALAAGTIEKFDAAQAKKAKKLGTVGWSARLRGKDYTGEGADIIIDPRGGAGATGALKSKPSSKWETLLRRAQYAAALNAVLETNDSGAILTLLTALQHRSALRTAVAGRSAADLLPVLRWVTKHVGDPRSVKLTSAVAAVLVEEYAEFAGQSGEVDVGFERLHEAVRGAAEMSQMAVSTVGMLDLLSAG
jgi:U3 small nucleolar RNA-associated protein 15